MYAISLRYAELSIVTMGWIVLLQVGVLVLDQQRYGLRLEPRRWAAVAVVIALQCYLVTSTAGRPAPTGSSAIAAAREQDGADEGSSRSAIRSGRGQDRCLSRPSRYSP